MLPIPVSRVLSKPGRSILLPAICFGLFAVFGTLYYHSLTFVSVQMIQEELLLHYEEEMLLAKTALPQAITSMSELKDNVQPLFFVTPTEYGPTQMLDLVRLSQTLMHDRGIYWIVVEDAEECSYRVRQMLDRSGLAYAHLAEPTPDYIALRQRAPRFVNQRNRALDLIEGFGVDGVVYFGDVSNVYDIQLFNELRATKGVGVFSVAFSGNGMYERCLVDEKTEKVVNFATNWHPLRDFPIPLAALSFNTKLLLAKHPRFKNEMNSKHLESKFLHQLVNSSADLEPLLDNCRKIYVWNTETMIEETIPTLGDERFSLIESML